MVCKKMIVFGFSTENTEEYKAMKIVRSAIFIGSLLIGGLFIKELFFIAIPLLMIAIKIYGEREQEQAFKFIKTITIVIVIPPFLLGGILLLGAILAAF